MPVNASIGKTELIDKLPCKAVCNFCIFFHKLFVTLFSQISNGFDDIRVEGWDTRYQRPKSFTANFMVITDHLIPAILR